MSSARLIRRIQDYLAQQGIRDEAEKVSQIVDFVRLTLRALRLVEPSERERRTLIGAIASRTGYKDDQAAAILSMALSPEFGGAVSDFELRAFRSRFGDAAAEALRRETADEVDLAAFSRNYGGDAAILLLDTLFSVAAADGQILEKELDRLRQAAGELGVDGVLVSALIHKHDPEGGQGASSQQQEHRESLRGDRIIIGRARKPACDVVLADPQVAPQHAVLVRSPAGWRIEDLGSGRPVVVDSRPVREAPVTEDSQIRIGPYRLQLSGDHLIVRARPSFSALTVRNLKRKIGDVTLLDDVSFTLFSGEVVALVGPSGAGKTTLLTAISGVAPADSGEVLLDQKDFHALLEADRSLVGSVPQDDLVSPELTVEESLRYSGQLRLPGSVSRGALEDRVTEVLTDLGIQNVRSSRIGDALRRGISGGQRKRVNLGQELMSRSTKVLFLDEPTSGLDPQASQDIIRLVRLLADEGRMVFLVTHDLTPEILAQVDHLMVLARGGRVAFFGPAREATSWFNVSTPDAIFRRLADHSDTEWAQMYRESDAYRKYVTTRERLFTVQRASAPRKNTEKVSRAGPLRQFATLSRRYLKTKLRDRTGLLVMGFQPPFLAAVMGVLFPAPTVEMLFMLSLSALWFGLSASVRELISDRVIWRRERRVGIGVVPYVASKVVVLAGFTALQALVLTAANYLILGMGGEYAFSFPLLLLTSVLTAWVGMATGLLVSAMWTSSEAAVGTLPLLLIPQIAFSSILLPLKDMGAAAKACTWITFQRYTFDAAIKCGDQIGKRDRVGDYDPQPVNGALYDLGLKFSSKADDVGFELGQLLAILATMTIVLVGTTTVRVWLRDR